MSQVLIVDRRGDLARFSLAQSFGRGTQILPSRIKLRYELGVPNLRLCRVACTEAALFFTLANQHAQIIGNASA